MSYLAVTVKSAELTKEAMIGLNTHVNRKHILKKPHELSSRSVHALGRKSRPSETYQYVMFQRKDSAMCCCFG